MIHGPYNIKLQVKICLFYSLLEERTFRQFGFGNKTQTQLGKVRLSILFTETVGVDTVNTGMCVTVVKRLRQNADCDVERLLFSSTKISV